MLYTIPAEITNNKDKVYTKIDLWVEFLDLPAQTQARRYGNNTDQLYIEGASDGVVVGNYFSSASANFDSRNTKGGDKIDISGDGEYIVASTNSDTALTLTDLPTPGSGLTWQSEHIRDDNLSKGVTLNVSVKIPELINGFSSIGSCGFRLTPFRAEIRGEILASPEIIGTEVIIWFKFDAGATPDIDNSVKIFRGTIYDWDENRDVMNIKIKNKEENLLSIPNTSLKESYPYYIGGNNGWARPIQFGDFNWNNDLQYWAEWKESALAIVPWLGYDGDQEHNIFFIADHVMENVPTATDFEETSVMTTSDKIYTPGYMFGRIGNYWASLGWPGAAPTAVVTNSSGCSYITISGKGDAGVNTMDSFVMLGSPGAEYATGTTATYENDIVAWAKCVDGDSTTSTDVPFTQYLSVHDLDLTNLGGLRRIATHTIYVAFSIGSVTITGGNPRLEVYDKSSESLQDSRSVGSGDADETHWLSFTVTNTEDINDYFFTVYGGAGTPATIEIKNITIWMTTSTDFEWNWTIDPYMYIRAQGREFSSAWIGLTGSRRTSGALIENPADVIESILWDDQGYIGQTSSNDGKIETQSFDDVRDIFNTAGVDACGTILTQSSGEEVLKSICRMFNMSLSFTQFRRWRLHFPQAAGYNFTNSGSGTPDDQDIFTDVDIVTNQEYTRHPIVKKSLVVRRSKSQEKYGTVVIRYGRLGDGSYFGTVSVGSGKSITLSNFLLNDSVNAAAFRDLVDGWLQNSKTTAIFNTWHNAVTHEIGDIINIRHGDINDAMLNATEVTQKWMIIDNTFKWRPPYIQIKAIELI
jgi:hypothetical protein